MKNEPLLSKELNDEHYLFENDVEEDNALTKDLSNRNVAKRVFDAIFSKPPDYVERCHNDDSQES